MRITFILPGFISMPMGGVKVVHEYANRLSNRGHTVTLAYPIQLQTNLRYYLKKFLVQQYDTFTGNDRELYYTPDSKVSVLTVKNISNKYVQHADVIIAVGWQTAGAVANLSTNCGKKYYLLQSFETYFGNAREVLQTYHLPLKKIAVSSWIIDEIKALGETAAGPLGNAINRNEFYLESNNTERSIDVMFYYHPAKIKGIADTLNVLKHLKKMFPKMTAMMISAHKPVHRIPGWTEQHIRPTIDELRHLYNSSKIFLHTSHWEGWGLPVMEAMACGCVVIAFRNRGINEFVSHQINGLLTEIGDRQQMIKLTKELLSNPAAKTPLIQEAFKTVAQYSWTNCVEKFESILKNLI